MVVGGGRIGVIVVVALLSGCAVGPDFLVPAPPPVSGYTKGRTPTQTASAPTAVGASQRFVRGRDIPGDWWQLFHSRALRALVEEAIRNNYDLQAAQAALRVARANTNAQRGAFFPQADGAFSATRQKVAADNNGDLSIPRIFNTFTGQVNVSYVPDVFGANRRAVESLEGQEQVQLFQLEATHLTLTTNVVVAAVQEASLRGQIAATRQIIKIVTDVLGVMRRQQGLGQIAEADVVAQEAALAQIEQTLPPLQRQLEQQRHLLAALVGRFPSEEPSQRFELTSVRLPQKLPLSLPSNLVQQRPDVRVAQGNLASASANIGVAVANRLPNIALTANVGSTAFDISKMFSPGTGFWTLGGAVLQPIFHGGTLLNRELSARAAYDQADSQYRSTVITAFQNVADTLTALRTDADALQKAVASERAASRSLEIARRRLELGDITFLLVLNAQQTYQQALLSLVQAKANRLADTAALYQALGGGWWNRNDIAPEPPSQAVMIFQ
jgi:NodT family efflux transporter outer membrane factor (OMF) lipoprotein